MKQQAKLSQKSESVVEQQSSAQAAKEFAGPDELLRFDAAHTILPAELEQRLKKSAAQVPATESRPWWKNLFGR